MRALRLIKETSDGGVVQIEIPKAFGKRVEIIVMPVSEESENEAIKATMVREGLNDEERFLAASYYAVIEDDKEEDAVWRQYIK